MAKKYLRIEMTIEANLGLEIWDMAQGKAVELTVNTVRHGGEDANGGLRAAPSGRELVLAMAQSRASFTTKEMNEEAERLGSSKQACAQAIYKLMRDQVIVRSAPKTYSLASVVNEKTKTGKPRLKAANGGVPAAASVPGHILQIVKAKQNGSGEGISIKVIKEALKEQGVKSKNISPAITDLLRRKLIARVAPATYRVEA